MKTCKIVLFSGRTKTCSREAADMALAVESINRYPQLAARLAPAIKSITEGADLLAAIEKTNDPERVKEMLSKILTVI